MREYEKDCQEIWALVNLRTLSCNISVISSWIFMQEKCAEAL